MQGEMLISLAASAIAVGEPSVPIANVVALGALGILVLARRLLRRSDG